MKDSWIVIILGTRVEPIKCRTNLWFDRNSRLYKYGVTSSFRSWKVQHESNKSFPSSSPVFWSIFICSRWNLIDVDIIQLVSEKLINTYKMFHWHHEFLLMHLHEHQSFHQCHNSSLENSPMQTFHRRAEI